MKKLISRQSKKEMGSFIRASEGSGYSGAPASPRLIAREIEKEEVGRSIGDRKLNA